MKKYSRILRKVCAIAVTILMTVSFVVTDRPDQVFAASTIKVTAVTMTYNDTQYDVYNNVTTISTDYQEEVVFDFQLNNTSRYSYLVEFYSEQEDGTQKLMWQDHNTTHASFNLYDLLPDSGIRMVVYEVSGWVTKKDDLMLGVLVEEGKNRKLFTSTVEIGPDKGATVDMSSLNEGMSFSMNPFPIPIVYKKFPDGRSVIGLGWNASNQGFWKQAEAGNFPTLSHGQLVKRWEDEHGTKEVSKFGLSWSVSGYATTFSDDPDKMTGTIQFYAGTGAEAAGQYLIFTYSITVTVGVDGSLVFSLKPKQEKDLDPLMLNEEQRKAGEDEFLTDFDLNATAGLELYGGIGIGCLLSAGIYGSATFVASMHMYPGFYMKEVYVDGEMGIKAKALGRTVLTFTFVKDRMDFYKRLEADGTEVYSSEINLRDEFVRQYNDLLSTDYGNKVYEVEEPEGKTIWESRTNLTDLSETEGGSLRTEDGMIVGDAGYAKKIASNVHPDAGIQVEKMNNNTDAVIALVANNAERSAGNKGELQYLLYSNSDKSYTVPKPVCRDINGDGREDTGADYDPRMKHNPENGKIYLVWKRGQDEPSNKLTLTEAARINKLCFAEYDETNDRWIQQAILLDDPDILIGDAAIGYQYVDASDPCVYMYTNPADDPAGLSANSQHDILVFKKNSNGNWAHTTMKTVTGRITSFDGGYYFFGESSSYHSENAVAYTLEDDNGHSTVNVVSNYYNPDSVSRESGESNETVVFNNARNGKFAMTNDILGLAFTEDGVLYTANGYRQNYKNRQFPKEEGEKISEAPFEIIGDIQNGTALIGYRASVDGSQNIKGFIRNYSNSKWYRAEMTDVAANANVGYFGGAFFKNDEPMLIYTVQEYSINNDEGSSGKYEDGISDLYIQAGEVNSHVSAVSAEVTNLHDLGKDNTPAKVSTLVQNNGIQPVNKITAYTKKAGEPDTAYQIAEEYDIETLYPGQSREITFDLSGDFGDPTKYIVGVTTRSEKESGNRMQSTTVLDIPEGDLVITDADYAYRNLSHDRYRVTATMAGPGQKSGTIVFYNTETKEVYKSVPLENVKSGQTVTAELINEKGYLSSVYSHLGAAILTGEESIDTIQPSPDDQEVKLIPKWFMTSSNESDVNSCPRDDRCPMAPFTDVDSQAWYHNGAHWAIEKGIMDGTGEKVFEPMNSSSRAMMVTILWRMEGSPVVDYNISFKDVADGQWYSDAVRWAAANGIVNGYSEEIFAPEDLVTREQIVTILYRYALFKGMDVNVGENLQLNDFTDAGEIAEWAVDAFCWAVDLGIIQGMTNTTLSPKSSAVRAQVATMLMRYSSIVA